MRMARLGDDGPEISVLGFGAWAAGGPWVFGWGPQDDEQSVEAMRHAVDLGVNWVDTAPAYGWGHSEEVVGRAVGDSDDVLVFTKCGVLRPESDDEATRRSLHPDSIRAECEASLRRLGRDHVDVYQFHWPHPDDTVPVEDSWATMLDLVESGLVRWPAVSNFDVPLLEACEATGHVQSLQPPYSLLNRAAETDVLPWCRANGTGVVVYSPMQAGLLTGAFSRERLVGLDAGDWRHESPWFRRPTFDRVLELVELLQPVADECELTLAELALAWVLANPAVTGAIVGARRPDQIDDWIGAGVVDLSPSLAADLARMAREIVGEPDEPDEPDAESG